MRVSDHDDLLAPSVVADPYGYFAELRTHDPVYWNERWGGWILTRYQDVLDVYRDPRVSSDRVSYLSKKLSSTERRELAPSLEILSNWIVFSDPPQHTRFRSLVSKAFTPRSIERLRPRVALLVDEFIDALPTPGVFDLIEDFAYPLPVTVIGELFGLPRESRHLLKRWSDEIALLVTSALAVDDRRFRSQKALIEFNEYLRRILERRRTESGEDLISNLLAAKEDGVALGDDEILATCSMILFAGHETTTNLIANGVLALVQNPDQLAKLRDDATLVPSAVEECLRFDSPVKAISRIAAEDLEIGGKRIRSGQRMLLVQGAANRDPEVFSDPDRFDISRDPNPHLAFAFGTHFCIGAALARMEMQVVLEGLLLRIGALELATPDLEWRDVIVMRALEALPLRG